MRLLRLESHRRALVWQKKYLTLLLNQIQIRDQHREDGTNGDLNSQLGLTKFRWRSLFLTTFNPLNYSLKFVNRYFFIFVSSGKIIHVNCPHTMLNPTNIFPRVIFLAVIFFWKHLFQKITLLVNSNLFLRFPWLGLLVFVYFLSQAAP